MCSPCKECENVSPSCSEGLNFLKDVTSAAAEAARYLWSLCLVLLMNSPSLGSLSQDLDAFLRGVLHFEKNL